MSRLFLLLLLAGCSRTPDVTDPSAPPTGTIEGEHALDDQSAVYNLYVPETDGTLGLAVLLPGDGWPGSDLIGESRITDWADANGYIILSADAPGPNQSGCWWTPHKHDRAAFLVDLIQQRVLDVYEVDTTRVHLGGWSGGAFLAFGVPFYEQLGFSGGLIGVCGGDLPREDSSTDWCEVDETQDDPLLDVADATFDAVASGGRVYLSTTTGDDWYGAITAARDTWTAHGATVHFEDEGSGGHCDYDVTGAFVAGLDWLVAE